MDHRDFLKVLNDAAENNASLEVRFACLAASAFSADEFDLHARALGVQSLCDRLRVPSACRDLAMLTVRVALEIESVDPTNPEALFEFVERADGFRQPLRFAKLIETLGFLGVVSRRMDSAGRGLNAIRLAYQIASSVDAKSVARAASLAGLSGLAVGQAIRLARIESIAAFAGSGRTSDVH